MLNSEQLLNECVRRVGGRRVDEIVGPSPGFSNADYLFPEDDIIAETKALEKDFLTAADVEEKLHQLYNRWVEQGRVNPGYGHVTISTDQIPPDCARELIDVFRRPLKEHLQKANQQIKRIRTELKRPNALGLLLLSNEGNYALDPEMTFHCLYHLLKTQLSGVEHVVYLSANLVVSVPGTRWKVPPFYPVSIPGRREPSHEFLMRLGTHWYAVLADATGTKLPPFTLEQGGPADVQTARFEPR